MRTVLRTLLASLGILVASGWAFATITHGFRVYTAEGALRLDVSEHPRVVPRVLLETADGDTVGFERWRGEWLLVDFIYTRCTSYCSVQGSQYARLQRELSTLVDSGKVHLLSISFDPEHDGPLELNAYRHRSGAADFTGWSVARPQHQHGLDALLRTFGVTVIDDGMGGFVHNAALAVVDPDGRLVRIVDWDAIDEAQRYIRSYLHS